MKQSAVWVSRKIIPNGVEIMVERRNFQVTYPVTVWKEFPDSYRQNFADSLAYSFTMHLCLNGHQKIQYNFPHPAIEPYLFESMIYSQGETVMVSDKEVTLSGLIKLLYNRNLNIGFTGRPRHARFSRVVRNNKNRAVIPFSFGKDSLLTFALCQELGIDSFPVFFREPKSPIENRYKRKLAQRFYEKFAKEIYFFPLSVGRLRQTFGSWWGWDMLFTQYTLLLIPYLFNLRSRYLFWSHEQDCNDSFENSEGYQINPVFEQSTRWVLATNNLARELGSNTIIASIVEPVHEIVTTWILHHRYPEIAKFQFSCFAEEKSKASSRWCGLCEKCCTMYLFFRALGIDPKNVNLKENLFSAKSRENYVLFDNRRTDSWRDQQLFAFYLASKKGAKGELINEFQKKYLKEAKTRENQLREKFFGIHTTATLTYELKKPLLKIFQEELAYLQ